MTGGDLVKVEEEAVDDAEDEAGASTDNGDESEISVLDIEHHLPVLSILMTIRRPTGRIVGVLIHTEVYSR